MALVWEYTLSEGDIKNGNIRFADSPLRLGSEYFGGKNAGEPAARTLTVVFSHGSTSTQWLYGDKKIFANRNPHSKDFFARIGAVAGGRIRITRTNPNSLLIEKA